MAKVKIFSTPQDLRIPKTSTFMGKRWLKKELDFLNQNYKRFTNNKLSQKLFRTEGAIAKRKHKLRLKSEEDWNRTEVIKKLKLLNEQLGHPPTVREVEPKLYQASTRYFGSFNNAKKAAKLTVNKPKYNPIQKSAYEISPSFAYVLGVKKGDGHSRIRIEPRRTTGEIILKVKSKDFALNFKKELENWSGINAKIYFRDNYHISAFYSVDAVRIVKDFDINKILGSEDIVKSSFLRGLFDSEGSVAGSNLTDLKRATRYIHFSNSEKTIIDLVSKLLKSFNIKYNIKSRIHSGFNSKRLQYEIIISGYENILKFYRNIGFSILLKQTRCKGVLESYER